MYITSGARYDSYMNESPETIEHLRHILSRFGPVEAAYLFGSRAQGRARADSDYDLALAGPAAELVPLKLDILQALADEGFERVDLVFLEQADPFTRFEAVRPN